MKNMEENYTKYLFAFEKKLRIMVFDYLDFIACFPD